MFDVKFRGGRVALLVVAVVASVAGPCALAGAAETSSVAALVFTDPTRILDTATGIGVTPHRTQPGETVHLAVVEADVDGRPTGVPAVAVAVMLQLTARDADGPGFVTAWSCQGEPPATSVLNVAPDSPRANLAVVDLDGNGDLCLFSSAAVDLTADVVAWIPAGAAFDASAPRRAYDSRSDGPLVAGRPRPVALAGFVPVAGGAGAAVISVTGVAGGEDGLLAVHSCRSEAGSSSLPLVKAEAVAATLIVPVDDGSICLTASVKTDVVVDVAAWYPKAAGVGSLTARRLLDRPTRGSAPVGERVGGFEAPGGATAALFTVTSHDAAGVGLVSLHPCDQPFRAIGAAPLTVKAGVATFVVPVTAAGVCLTGTIDSALTVDVRATLGSADSGAAPYVTPAGVALPSGRSNRTRPFKVSVTVGEETLDAAAWPGRYPQQEFGYLGSDQLPAAVGRLRVGDSSGRAIGVCSATVVGPNLVLTAAHCVVADDGQQYGVWEFRPGQFGPTNPTGAWSTSRAYVDPGYRPGSPTFDYALLRFDEVRLGHTIGDTVGWFPVGLGKAALGGPTVALGYPIEGFFAGGCTSGACYPWYCAAPPSNVASSGPLGGRSVGIGCVAAGGMSGGGVFALVDDQWLVVSLVSVGPRFDAAGLPCNGNNCYYGHNVTGPEFSAGFFDRLWDQARA